MLIGLVADVISGTRKLIEDVLYRVRMMELRQAADDDDDDSPPRSTSRRADG
jgi:hypothetical protein